MHSVENGMEVLAYVESPGQLINAYELVGKDVRLCVVVRLNGSAYNDEQIRSVHQLYASKVPATKTVRLVYVSSLFGFLFALMRTLLFSSKRTKVYVGSYRSGFVRVLKLFYPKLILVDDGVATLAYQKESCYRGRGLDLFTFLDVQSKLPSQNIEENSFGLLKTLSDGAYPDANSVWFFGSKYIVAGLIDKPLYEDLLKEIFGRMKGMSITYIPHREELDADLEPLRGWGVNVERLMYPSEISLVLSSSRPTTIAGFYTASLATAKKIFPESRVVAYDVSECVAEKYRPAYQHLKDYYQTLGEVVELK